LVTGTYVQYGCGLSAPSGWLNFDASPRLRLERNFLAGPVIAGVFGRLFPPGTQFGDVVAGLPVASGAADGVYCSHILEHLASDDVGRALAETMRILRPGGTFRLVVPALRWRAEQYVRAHDAAAADEFLNGTMLGHRTRPRCVLGHLRSALGNSAHLWMFDFEGMRHRLTECGFVGVRPCEFGDARDPAFGAVEDRDRFFAGGERELSIEALKAK
jgi:hypothetical protein